MYVRLNAFTSDVLTTFLEFSLQFYFSGNKSKLQKKKKKKKKKKKVLVMKIHAILKFQENVRLYRKKLSASPSLSLSPSFILFLYLAHTCRQPHTTSLSL